MRGEDVQDMAVFVGTPYYGYVYEDTLPVGSCTPQPMHLRSSPPCPLHCPRVPVEMVRLSPDSLTSHGGQFWIPLTQAAHRPFCTGKCKGRRGSCSCVEHLLGARAVPGMSSLIHTYPSLAASVSPAKGL